MASRERRREVSWRSRAFRRTFVFRSSLTSGAPCGWQKAEAEQTPDRCRGDATLGPVHLELEWLLHEGRHAIEDSLSRPFAGHVDPEVVGVADERVAPPLQLVVEVVEHDVRKERVKRGEPCGVPSTVATFTLLTMTPASR